MNYYETLNVSKDASPEEIKKSYRKLVKEHHPDKTGGDDTQFKQISEAYENLSDPAKRQQYDNQSSGYNPFNNFNRYQDNTSPFQHAFHGFGGDFADMFNQSFGGEARGYDIRDEEDYLDIKLDGWSDQVNDNLNEYDDIFGELFDLYKEKLMVVGFPANDFGGQEPGSNADIQVFCTKNYGVTFPMAAKISVTGKGMAPIYQYLTQKEQNGVLDAAIKWNFNKFLIDETGFVIKKFESSVSPMSKEIISLL